MSSQELPDEFVETDGFGDRPVRPCRMCVTEDSVSWPMLRASLAHTKKADRRLREGHTTLSGHLLCDVSPI
jgi:hypothetical protein